MFCQKLHVALVGFLFSLIAIKDLTVLLQISAALPLCTEIRLCIGPMDVVKRYFATYITNGLTAKNK
jgi:hypothetical protein